MVVKEINSKSSLAIALSKLKGFESPDVKKEQYMTDSEVAATILWLAYMKGDIKDKIIADFGAGTGILAIGALLLGASKVFFVEIDKNALEIAENSYKAVKSEYTIGGEAVFINKDVVEFYEKVDTVIENPPFGVKNEHSDKVFLESAIQVADVIYSLHKSESSGFIMAFCNDNGFEVGEEIKVNYPLKASLSYHTKRIHRFDASFYRIYRR